MLYINYAVMLTGGKDVRFEGDIPKQFVELMGKSLLAYSMKTAQENDNADAICVVSSKEYYDRARTWADKYRITKLLFVAEVGRERCQSVYSGLKSPPVQADDTVIIMTAVCLFVSQLAISKLYKVMETKDACIAVVKATDAIILSNNRENVLHTLQRKKLFIQQGPQLFRYGILKQAYKAYLSDENRTEVNEDSEPVLNTGVECGMVIGDRLCIKVTYPEDLAIVEALYPLLIKQKAKIGERM